ncbi:hypothetical protein E2P71_06440, partial [Candidatus Bathyarchaeota archaeon]
PETAELHGLQEGDMAVIETSRGRITQKVKHNKDLDPRIVYAAFGWSQANLNELSSWEAPLCEAMGAATFRGIPCRVKPDKTF